MHSNLSSLESAPSLREVSAECLSAINGGANNMLFNFKTLTGVMFADDGIWYMKGDGKWIQVTKH